MKTLLVTGYEPFGGRDTNPSWEAASMLPDEMNGVRIVKRELPVVYSRGTRLLNSLIDELKPDAVLSLGLAGGRRVISIERMAFNLRETSSPDNDGYVAAGERIAPDGDDGYFTTLPNREMKEALEKENIPAELSTSPGFYLCNNAMYVAQYRIHTDMPQMIGGFVHVPLTTDMEGGAEGFEPETLFHAIAVCARVICKTLQNG